MNYIPCKISDPTCIYHACMSDHCQKEFVKENDADWGPGNCEIIKIPTMNNHLSNRGNVDDIRNSMKLGHYDTRYLKKEIVYEQKTRNRSTVIKLYESSIRKNEKAVKS